MNNSRKYFSLKLDIITSKDCCLHTSSSRLIELLSTWLNMQRLPANSSIDSTGKIKSYFTLGILFAIIGHISEIWPFPDPVEYINLDKMTSHWFYISSWSETLYKANWPSDFSYYYKVWKELDKALQGNVLMMKKYRLNKFCGQLRTKFICYRLMEVFSSNSAYLMDLVLTDWPLLMVNGIVSDSTFHTVM